MATQGGWVWVQDYARDTSCFYLSSTLPGYDTHMYASQCDDLYFDVYGSSPLTAWFPSFLYPAPLPIPSFPCCAECWNACTLLKPSCLHSKTSCVNCSAILEWPPLEHWSLLCVRGNCTRAHEAQLMRMYIDSCCTNVVVPWGQQFHIIHVNWIACVSLFHICIHATWIDIALALLIWGHSGNSAQHTLHTLLAGTSIHWW